MSEPTNPPNISQVNIHSLLYNNTTKILYTGTVIDNIPNGFGTAYRLHDETDPNNQQNNWKWFEGNFTNGILSGLDSKIYYANGNLHYIGNTLEGKKEGQGTLYHFNGMLSYKGLFKSDLPFGSLTYSYNEAGKIVYRGGQNLSGCIGFGMRGYTNGQTKFIGEFDRQQPKNGNVLILKENGSLGFIGKILNG